MIQDEFKNIIKKWENNFRTQMNIVTTKVEYEKMASSTMSDNTQTPWTECGKER
jgi:hypothetical protein